MKRRVIFHKPAASEPVVVKPRNLIVQWEAPQVQIKKEYKYLGVVTANPAEYVAQYGASLTRAAELPDFVLAIAAPAGLTLAADAAAAAAVPELEGDVHALRLVDLEREGLGEYAELVRGLSSRAVSRSSSFASGSIASASRAG